MNDEYLGEYLFEQEIKKEVSVGEFKDAHTHGLKRRFAEYYDTQKRKWPNLKNFTIGHNPIEKFKDIQSIFTIALYPEYVVVGPLEKERTRHQYTDVINVLLSYINKNMIHPYLLDLLDRGDYPFYDNHIVVEIIDHRESEPQSKRVLLQGLYSGLPFTTALLMASKTTEEEEAYLISKTMPICLDPTPELFEYLKLQDYNKQKLDNVKIDSAQRRKVHIESVIKEYKRTETALKKEPFPGLERPSTARIYRTVRFVGGNTHYSINALANPDHIEIVFRKGDTINTASNGFITRRKFTSPAQIDLYIDSTKRLLEIYHTDLKCICDISANPRKSAPMQNTKYNLSHYRAPNIPEHRRPPQMSTTQLHPHTSHPMHSRFMPLTDIPSPQAHDSPKASKWKEPSPKKELDDFSFDYVNKKFI
ncbi:hypothetical protein NEOKW01_0865 [Nematocida sp. AWRm80]|nr:hypothetical protein NEOKW01_0865 [Nematocida sp. AWRm80]